MDPWLYDEILGSILEPMLYEEILGFYDKMLLNKGIYEWIHDSIVRSLAQLW